MRVLLISANREDINMPAPPMDQDCAAAAVQRTGRAVKFLELHILELRRLEQPPMA